MIKKKREETSIGGWESIIESTQSTNYLILLLPRQTSIIPKSFPKRA